MRMSRYGLLGMALVISTFVLVLLLVAPKPNDQDPARRLARLGAAIEMYCVRHDGRLPAQLDVLAEEELLPPEFVRSMEREVKFVAAGRSRDSFPAHGIVAMEDPGPVRGSIRVHVLLSDGAVLAVPADVVREAATRPGAAARLDSAPDGQITMVFVDND